MGIARSTVIISSLVTSAEFLTVSCVEAFGDARFPGNSIDRLETSMSPLIGTLTSTESFEPKVTFRVVLAGAIPNLSVPKNWLGSKAVSVT